MTTWRYDRHLLSILIPYIRDILGPGVSLTELSCNRRQRNSLSWIIISHQTHAPKSLSMQSCLTPFPDDRASISLPC
ncbi:hypothetical protein EYC84_007640 [Monilinia fructicola]|uniref:Uncharacterized protein n=1 Tax=Monilinia fructicola TaxID=38448 RepID=A0A5M9JKY0_MONFR|nr:hypothetical protein EYC84_007640 [Monilinia fructicola]